MVRRGMVTIGLAVQAETFSNDDENDSGTHSNSNCNFNESPSCSSSFPGASASQTSGSGSSKSATAIFLPPSADGSPQTLKITFTYNKETNLPEIIVNLDGETGQNKYLELKELSQGQSEGKSFAELYAPKPTGKDLQVYYFDKINMGSQEPQSQIIEVPPTPVPAIMGSVPEEKAKEKPRGFEILSTEDSEIHGAGKVGTGTGNFEEFSKKIPKSIMSKSTKSSSQSNSGESIEEKERQGRKSEKKSPKSRRSDGHDNDPDDSISSGSNSRNTSKTPKTPNMDGNGHEKLRRSRKSRTPSNHHVSFSPERRTVSPTKDIGDKSKIPVIHSSATGFMPSCEYYRQKWLQEVGCTDYPCEPWTNYYSSIQKNAGQKVVNKLTAQQKHLEEHAAAQRKRTEFVYHEELGFCEVPEKIPLRKKQTRLEPLRSVPKCC